MEPEFKDEGLPDDIVFLIASYCSHETNLMKLSLVSQRLYQTLQAYYRSICHKQEVDTKDVVSAQGNWMNVFGKLLTRRQVVINLRSLTLDPFKDQVVLPGDDSACMIIKDSKNKVNTRGKQFKILIQDGVASLAASSVDTKSLMQDTDLQLVKVSEKVLEVCVSSEQFLLRTDSGVEHGLVQIVDEQVKLQSLQKVDIECEGTVDYISIVGEQCFAIVKDQDRHRIFSWTLEDLSKKENVTFEVPIIPDEEATANKKEGPILHYPLFKQIAVTFNACALLSNDGRIFNVDAKGKECAPFRKVDRIVKIAGGSFHFLALRQVIMRPVELWEEDEVAEFFAKIGFPETGDIIKHSKVKGTKLWPFDEDYIADTLGLVGANEQQKIRYELSLCQVERVTSQSIIGWGANVFSQLGLSSIVQSSGIPAPKQLPVPTEVTDCSSTVIDVICGIRHSVILTDNGKVWVTGGVKKEKAQVKKGLGEGVAEEEKLDPDLMPPEKSKKKGKKSGSFNSKNTRTKFEADPETGWQVEKRLKNDTVKESKQRQAARELNKLVQEQENSVEHRWIDISDNALSLIRPTMQIDGLVQIDDKLFMSGSWRFKKVEAGQMDESENRWTSKFRDIDKIAAGIIYKQKIENCDKQYTVCYEDRFLGIVETEVWRFHLELEVPSHRVRQLKCDGEIIWDRKAKFSKI